MKYFFVFLGIILLLTSCGTVSPSIIGSETRVELETLVSQQTESVIQVERIEGSAKGISDSLKSLETRVPDVLKPEFMVLRQKADEHAGQVSILKDSLEAERATVQEAMKAAVKADVDTATLADEKARAEIDKERMKGQRNIAYVIIFFFCAIIVLGIVIKLRRLL